MCTYLTREQGHLNMAFEYATRANVMYNNCFKKSQAHIARSLHTIGTILTRQKCYEEAEKYLRHSIEMKSSVFHTELHQEVAHSYKALGELYMSMNQPTRALGEFKRSLECYKAKLDDSHPFVRQVMQLV